MTVRIPIASQYKKDPQQAEAQAFQTADMEEASKKKAVGDKYRSYLEGEGENIHWRHGSPLTYDLVNKLFEEGRTKKWPEGSLEEKVQNAIKTWEMELSHKTRLEDFKSNPEKFKFIVNGRQALSGEETLKLGSYNALLQSTLLEEMQYYKADWETFEPSHELFRTALPHGFTWEVLGGGGDRILYSPGTSFVKGDKNFESSSTFVGVQR